MARQMLPGAGANKEGSFLEETGLSQVASMYVFTEFLAADCSQAWSCLDSRAPAQHTFKHYPT